MNFHRNHSTTNKYLRERDMRDNFNLFTYDENVSESYDSDLNENEIDEIDNDIISTLQYPSKFLEIVPKLPGKKLKLDNRYSDNFNKANQNDDSYFNDSYIADTTLSQLAAQIQSDLDRLKVGFSVDPSDDNFGKISEPLENTQETAVTLYEDIYLLDSDNDKIDHTNDPVFQFLANNDEKDSQNILFLKSINDKEMNKAIDLFQKIRDIRYEMEEKAVKLGDLTASINTLCHESDDLNLFSKSTSDALFINNSSYISNDTKGMTSIGTSNSTSFPSLSNPDSISTISKKVISNLHVAMDTLLSNFPDGENGLVKSIQVEEVKAPPVMSIVPPNIIKPVVPEQTRSQQDSLGNKVSESAVFYQVTSAALEKQLKAIDQKMNDISVGNMTSATSSSLNYSRYSSKIPLALEKTSSVPFKVVRSNSSKSNLSDNHILINRNAEINYSPHNIMISSAPNLIQAESSGDKKSSYPTSLKFSSEYSLVKQKENELLNLQTLKNSIRQSLSN